MSSTDFPPNSVIVREAAGDALAVDGYSTREVAELIGLPAGRIRHYARRQVVCPQRGRGNEYRFGLRDVVVLRNAKRLIDSQVSARTTLRLLIELSSQHHAERRPLHLVADGARVLVRREGVLWDVDSGQGELAFGDAGDSARASAQVTALNADTQLIAREHSARSSDDWYNLGLDLEDLDLDRAIQAYRRALELDPANADAHVNLGRLQQLDGELDEARRCYRRALQVEPDHQLANYNLGTVYDELNELDQAQGCYLKAPIVADAHYNLARLCELRGDELSARRHLRQYRELLEGQL